MTDRRQETAFLDTNALHFLGIWIKYKRSANLVDYPKVADCCLKTLLANKDQGMREAIQKGRAIEQFCHKNDLRVQYSPISELELQIGLAKGRALLMLAGEHAPPRMWSRVVHDEKAINKRLLGEPLATCRQDLEEILDTLDDEPSLYLDRLIDQSQIWELARELSGLIYLSTCDCLIYANTLLAEAKYLITFDAKFRRIANCVYSSGNYEEVRPTLLGYIGENRSFPEARAPKIESAATHLASTQETP